MFRTLFATVLVVLAMFTAPAMAGAEESVVEVRLGDNGFKTASHVAFEYTGNWRDWSKFVFLHPTRDEELARDEESARRYPWGARVRIPVSMLKPEFRSADPVKPQIAAPAETLPKTSGSAIAARPEPKPTFYGPLPSGEEKSIFAALNEKLDVALAMPVVPVMLVGISAFSHVFIIGGLLLLWREARNGSGRSHKRKRSVEVKEDMETDGADEEDAGRMPLVLFRQSTPGQRLIKTKEEVRADFLQSFGDTFGHAALRGFGEDAETHEVRVVNASELVIEIGFREGVGPPLLFFRHAEELVRKVFRSLPHHEALEISSVEPSTLKPSLGMKIHVAYRGANGNGTSRAEASHGRLPAAV